MAVLVAGMRVLGANHGDSADGVLTAQKGALTNDYFVNLLDMGTVWQKSTGSADRYEGMDRKSGQKRWTATSVDLAFGSHSQLRAIAEVYASDDAKDKFVQDFIAAWTKVMDLDRFDVASRASK
jgi:catalase-peroxidase